VKRDNHQDYETRPSGAPRFRAWSFLVLLIQPIVIFVLSELFPVNKGMMPARPPRNAFLGLLGAICITLPTIIAFMMAVRELMLMKAAIRRPIDVVLSSATLVLALIILVLFCWLIYHDL